MNPYDDANEFKPEKLEEEKEGGPSFHCDLYDTDMVHKIAQELLPGLASACIDNTTGGLLKSPASVAVDIRREMVDYIVQRSENFVAEMTLEGSLIEGVSENPLDIISDFIDDFSRSKRNFFSRVSGWVLSEKREDWIDDFVQEMEINGFWLLNRRESVAQTFLKNVDFKNIYHCENSYKSQEEVEVHKSNCGFRTLICTNEGCNSRFCAAQMDHHDSTCLFKILKCEQNCPDSIMRREMDRHCITTCPMKLVKCSFYLVGCHSTIPQCSIVEHRSESLPSHLLYVLQAVHSEGSTESLNERVEELIKLSSHERLASARDARALTITIKDLDAKLGPLKVKGNENPSEEVKDLADKMENTCFPTDDEVGIKSSPSKQGHDINLSSDQEKEKLVDSPAIGTMQLKPESDDKESLISKHGQEN